VKSAERDTSRDPECLGSYGRYPECDGCEFDELCKSEAERFLFFDSLGEAKLASWFGRA